MGTELASQDEYYVRFHQRRYDYLLRIIMALNPAPGAACLDVGPSPFTQMLRRETKLTVDTLGLQPDSQGTDGSHFQLDLNDCQEVRKCRRDLGPYQVIVVAEVLEHLYTSPYLVLAYFRSLLVPGGHLIVQTPNAAALEKRFSLLLGKNPYPLIELTRDGHYRELTLPELTDYASQLDLRVESAARHRYFDPRYRKRLYEGEQKHAPPNLHSRVMAAAAGLASLIPAFRPGLTCVFRKRSDQAA